VLVAYARIPAIVVTLGMLSILKGGLISGDLGRLDHQPAAGFPSRPSSASSGFLPASGSPRPHRGGGAVDALFRAGRGSNAIGGNPDAARAAGIQTKPTPVVFVFALARLLRRDRANPVREPATSHPVDRSAQPRAQRDHGSVIGGVSILGGTGTVIGSTLAAVLFAAIGFLPHLLNVSAYWLRRSSGS